MINLFERVDEASKLLLSSLRKAGYNQPTIFLEDDGYLPAQTTSPYTFFLKKAGAKMTGKPLYFNQVTVPDYWEIKGSLKRAEVTNYNRQAAIIHYKDGFNQGRLVAKVEWKDNNGLIRLTEHYNQYGWCFKKTLYAADGSIKQISYQTQQGKEVIREDKPSGLITLYFQGKTYLFRNLASFTIFFLRQAGYQLDKIWYNSLSTPLFIIMGLPEAGMDTLFWQEGSRKQLPENMAFILRSLPRRKTRICITEKDAYESFNRLVKPAEQSRLTYLGYNYDYKRQNQGQKQALIMTNSDQIAHLKNLVESLPEMTFNIAAITEMSPKLLAFAKYPNVKLYPNVNRQQVKDLWQVNDYYLDINYQNEILLATQQAFLNQMLILGFVETSHTSKWGLSSNRYYLKDYQQLIIKLRQLITSPKLLEREIFLQKQAAEQTSSAYYREILN